MAEFNIDDILYLQNANIIKLQQAARLAGLRWKSGTPGYDKAGIIEKLQYNPSILRATVATLRRMENGPVSPVNTVSSTVNSFLDDIIEDAKEILVSKPIPRENPVIPQNPISEDYYPLRDGLTLESKIQNQARDIGAVDSKIDRTVSDYRLLVSRVESAQKTIAALETEIKNLQNQKPIEIYLTPVKKVTIKPGSHKLYPKLLEYLSINKRLLLTGGAGTGKSRAAYQAAEDMELEFYLQTPVSMSHELIGYRDAQGAFHETPTFKAYTRGGVLLLDEADASDPNAMLPGNPIFDGNGFAMFGDGKLHKMHPDFYVICNMNTTGFGADMGYSGRNRLDGATLDRFGLCIHWTIDENIENSMGGNQESWKTAIRAIRVFMTQRQILDVNATPRRLMVGAKLLEQGTQSRETILTDILKVGALSEVWADVLRLPAVTVFLKGN